MSAHMKLARVQYEMIDADIARIVLNRPEKRNAQDFRMLYELNNAFNHAAHDDRIKVIILAGAGQDFSSGHDLYDRETESFVRIHEEFPPVSCAGGYVKPGIEGFMSREEEAYLGFCWRWRNIPKPTIAEVQGHVIGGGLMLVWPCDLIVASDDATFVDPVVAMGLNGHEYHVHTWELGHRRAKEMLFTGEPITAEQAYQMGMVSRVVARADLSDETLSLARRIAKRPSFALRIAKQTVDQALEAQGMWTAVQAGFTFHSMAHSHNFHMHGDPIDPAGPALIRETLTEYEANQP
jgi:enoyl-CoA hydratase